MYVSSSLYEWNSNNRFKVQNDKDDSLYYYEHAVTHWSYFCQFT